MMAGPKWWSMTARFTIYVSRPSSCTNVTLTHEGTMQYADVQPGQTFYYNGERLVKLKPYAVDSKGDLWDMDDDDVVSVDNGITIAALAAGLKFQLDGRIYTKIVAPMAFEAQGHEWALDEDCQAVVFDANQIVVTTE